MALRSLATRAGEAGRELMGVHTQLHQQSARVSTTETTLSLLQEGFHALTDAQDLDRDTCAAVGTKIETIENRQIRILRRIKQFKVRLEKEITAAQTKESKNRKEAQQRNEAVAAATRQKLKEMELKNNALENTVNSLQVENQWMKETLKTNTAVLETTRQEVREQNKSTGRLITEMEKMTTALVHSEKRHQLRSEELDKTVFDATATMEEKHRCATRTVEESIQQLSATVEQKSNDMHIKVRASAQRQNLLRASVDDALTALATELKATLTMTRTVEQKFDRIVDSVDVATAENNMRFDAISQAIQALAAVVDDS